jgi:fructose-1-phosphate kinase PfkB-like protein
MIHEQELNVNVDVEQENLNRVMTTRYLYRSTMLSKPNNHALANKLAKEFRNLREIFNPLPLHHELR